MPREHGYSIYVAPNLSVRGKQGWTVRIYRDSDDEHVWSFEGGALSANLKDAGAKVIEDSLRDEEGAVA